jgi:hypothetical protein
MLAYETVKSWLGEQAEARVHAFEILKTIAQMAVDSRLAASARELVVRSLEQREAFEECQSLHEALIRQVGLFPYNEPSALSIRDEIAYEFHRPDGMEDRNIVFHSSQAGVYCDLLAGYSVILSAPTSYGKSLLVDALIASGRIKNAAIVVPTIALIDETRRRLSTFRNNFKIITHRAQKPAESNLFILTQERAIERDDFPKLDLLVVDEFYKLDPARKDADQERSIILNHAVYKLRKLTKQFYFLGPAIENVPDGIEGDYNCKFYKTDFTTVATNIVHLPTNPSDEFAPLREVCANLVDQTLIYCRSPQRVSQVVGELLRLEIRASDPILESGANWVSREYHPDWIFAKALRRGIGMHHGRVPRSLAQFVVHAFNSNKMRFLVCTSTLIEGVNTSAKNVIIFDDTIARARYDYFTFNNIVGRSGRMFRHFIGNVFVFGNPPPQQLDIIDIPIFTQTSKMSDSLIIQMDQEDIVPRLRDRFQGFFSQSELAFETIKANKHVNPDDQIALARYLRQHVDQASAMLSWTQFPTYDQLEYVCGLIDQFFVERWGTGIFSPRQLAFKINRLRQNQSVAALIRDELSNTQYVADADTAISNVLDFMRHWAMHNLPRFLMAISTIQAEVLGRAGRRFGDFSFFAARVENLFLPPAVIALDEYGLPIQITQKLGLVQSDDESLDDVIPRLQSLDLDPHMLSAFERHLVTEVQQGL